MPMQMPTPQAGYAPSLTMQYALSVPDDSSATLLLNTAGNRPTPPAIPPRPHSDEPRITSGFSGGTSSHNPSPERPQRLGVDSTPSGRPRASSSPSSPVIGKSVSSGTKGDDDKIQCSGVTKKGDRCTRLVKAPPPLSFQDPDAALPRFCFQHTKEVLEPTGFHSRKGGRDNWVTFEGARLLILAGALDSSARQQTGFQITYILTPKPLCEWRWRSLLHNTTYRVISTRSRLEVRAVLPTMKSCE